MKHKFKNFSWSVFWVLLLTVGCGVLPSVFTKEPTPIPPTWSAARGTRTPRAIVSTPTVQAAESPKDAPTITASGGGSSNPILPGIGEIVETDEWQFVVDSVETIATRPDGTTAAEGHQFITVALTVKNNNDQCRIWKATTPERNVDVPRKYDGGSLFASDFSPEPYPLVVPWILDGRDYGHAGFNDGIYSGYTFNAPPRDIVSLLYWFDVPIANSQDMKLYLETVSGLSQGNLIFDLEKKSAELQALNPEYIQAPIRIGQEATFAEHWAMTVTGFDVGTGQPFQQSPIVPQTTVIARVRNLQGIDASFPRTDQNPEGAQSDFYILNEKKQVATTSVSAILGMGSTMAPGLERDIAIPLYSLAPLNSEGLRFTAIVDIATCEYAHFSLGK